MAPKVDLEYINKTFKRADLYGGNGDGKVDKDEAKAIEIFKDLVENDYNNGKKSRINKATYEAAMAQIEKFELERTMGLELSNKANNSEAAPAAPAVSEAPAAPEAPVAPETVETTDEVVQETPKEEYSTKALDNVIDRTGMSNVEKRAVDSGARALVFGKVNEYVNPKNSKNVGSREELINRLTKDPNIREASARQVVAIYVEANNKMSELVDVKVDGKDTKQPRINTNMSVSEIKEVIAALIEEQGCKGYPDSTEKGVIYRAYKDLEKLAIAEREAKVLADMDAKFQEISSDETKSFDQKLKEMKAFCYKEAKGDYKALYKQFEKTKTEEHLKPIIDKALSETTATTTVGIYHEMQKKFPASYFKGERALYDYIHAAFTDLQAAERNKLYEYQAGENNRKKIRKEGVDFSEMKSDKVFTALLQSGLISRRDDGKYDVSELQDFCAWYCGANKTFDYTKLKQISEKFNLKIGIAREADLPEFDEDAAKKLAQMCGYKFEKFIKWDKLILDTLGASALTGLIAGAASLTNFNSHIVEFGDTRITVLNVLGLTDQGVSKDAVMALQQKIVEQGLPKGVTTEAQLQAYIAKELGVDFLEGSCTNFTDIFLPGGDPVKFCENWIATGLKTAAVTMLLAAGKSISDQLNRVDVPALPNTVTEDCFSDYIRQVKERFSKDPAMAAAITGLALKHYHEDRIPHWNPRDLELLYAAIGGKDNTITSDELKRYLDNPEEIDAKVEKEIQRRNANPCDPVTNENTPDIVNVGFTPKDNPAEPIKESYETHTVNFNAKDENGKLIWRDKAGYFKWIDIVNAFYPGLLAACDGKPTVAIRALQRQMSYEFIKETGELKYHPEKYKEFVEVGNLNVKLDHEFPDEVVVNGKTIKFQKQPVKTRDTIQSPGNGQVQKTMQGGYKGDIYYKPVDGGRTWVATDDKGRTGSGETPAAALAQLKETYKSELGDNFKYTNEEEALKKANAQAEELDKAKAKKVD